MTVCLLNRSYHIHLTADVVKRDLNTIKICSRQSLENVPVMFALSEPGVQIPVGKAELEQVSASEWYS